MNIVLLAIFLIVICVVDSPCDSLLRRIDPKPKTLIHLIPGVSIYRYIKFKQKLKENNIG